VNATLALQNSQKNSSFAKNKSVNNDKGTTTNSERPPLVGRPESRRGIYQTVEAGNLAGSIDTVREVEEREELESRGINPDWSRVIFRRELEKLAEQNGVLLDKSYLDDKELKHDHQVAATTENDVYLNPDGKTLTKVNNLSQVKGSDHKRNLKAFIDRLEAHNVLFPEVAYDVKGFIKNKRGFISLAMEQPYVDAERNATQEEIDKYLSDRGFWLEGKTLKHWTNVKYIIEDARPANVLKGKDGRLYFIDTIPHSVGYMAKKGGLEVSTPPPFPPPRPSFRTQ
jgi:hypothetical protein